MAVFENPVTKLPGSNNVARVAARSSSWQQTFGYKDELSAPQMSYSLSRPAGQWGLQALVACWFL